jgi:hypothetical protein
MTPTARWTPCLLAAAILACSPGGKLEAGSGPSAATAPAPIAVAAPTSTAGASAAQISPDDVPRIAPAEARNDQQAGKALLVCAYPDEAKYQSLKLEGSISLHELEHKLSSLGRDQEIIFYCA